MRSDRQWLYTLLILLVGGLGIYGFYQWRVKWKKEHVYVELRPIQTDLGWGFDIWTDKTRFMHQPFIPAIAGYHGFKTKEDALAVGQVIYKRIIAGELPTISPEEIKEMGLMPPPEETRKDDSIRLAADSVLRARNLQSRKK